MSAVDVSGMLWKLDKGQEMSDQTTCYREGNSVAFTLSVVCWWLNIPATCKCISGTDPLRQLYVLPHWDRSCRTNFPSHPVTVYWHWADQSQHWPYNARCLAGIYFIGKVLTNFGETLTQGAESSIALNKRNVYLLKVINCLFLCCYATWKVQGEMELVTFTCKLSFILALRCVLFSNGLYNIVHCTMFQPVK